MDAGRFPRPFRVGPSSVRWSEREIEEWVAALPRSHGDSEPEAMNMTEPGESNPRAANQGATAEASGAASAALATADHDSSPQSGGDRADAVSSIRSRFTEQALELVQQVVRTYQQVCEQVWELGDLLLQAKASLPHGEFLPWVEDIGLARRTAQRCMQLRKRVHEKCQLAHFKSVDAALKALPAARGNDQVESGPQAAGGDAGTDEEALAGEAPGTPRGDLAAEDPEARRSAVASEPTSSASDSAAATESPDTAVPSEPGSDSPTRTEPDGTSTAVPEAEGPEDRRPAGPSASGGPLPPLERADAVQPPEGAVRSGLTPDSLAENEAGEPRRAVPGPELGQEPAAPANGFRDAEASPASPPLLPTSSNDLPGGASGANEREVNGATAARTGDGADSDPSRCMRELRAVAERLDAFGGTGKASRFRAACHLVRTLASAMEQCLDASMDDSVLVAGLPSHVVASLDAQLASEIDQARSGNSEERVKADKLAAPTSTSKRGHKFLSSLVPWRKRPAAS